MNNVSKDFDSEKSEPFKRCLIKNGCFFVNKLFAMTLNNYHFINA